MRRRCHSGCRTDHLASQQQGRTRRGSRRLPTPRHCRSYPSCALPHRWFWRAGAELSCAPLRQNGIPAAHHCFRSATVHRWRSPAPSRPQGQNEHGSRRLPTRARCCAVPRCVRIHTRCWRVAAQFVQCRKKASGIRDIARRGFRKWRFARRRAAPRRQRRETERKKWRVSSWRLFD